MLHATFKSLLSRKVRLVLSGLAIIIGVMFVSGSFVLTDTMGRSLNQIFATAYAGIDVDVQAVPKVDNPGAVSPIPADRLGQVRATPGVAAATGIVRVDGARVIGSNGKVVTALGGTPRYGINWTGTDALIQLRQGRGPRADTEIAINAALATSAGVAVGDRVGVLTGQPKKTFTLVGIFGYSGGRDSIGGAQEVAFTEPVAQQLMLGGTHLYSDIEVDAEAGVAAETVRDRLAATMGPAYRVKTGKQLQAEATAQARKDLQFIN
ncbi:MAG TPA: ABC transporter permease, partial [Pilimelia sp.]|nr:ABC transporter permease [Pilimelia sp.]